MVISAPYEESTISIIMQKFLETVWPKIGNYLVAHPYTNGGFNQIAFETIELAAKQSEMWSKQGYDCYFAVGSVSSHGQNASRKSEVVKEFRTFILDIDCGDGKDYATQSEALEALKTFINKLNLPKPILVSSGYGWHVYWALTESITASEWLLIAQRFKQVVAHAGLVADRTRTADRASVLRVPGTINYKRGSQILVDVKKWGEPCQLSVFTKAIEEYAAVNNIEAPVERYKPDDESVTLLKEFGVISNLDSEFAPANFEMIKERCAMIRHCVEHNELLSEPLWRGALSIVKFCENGDELIHKVSENHPDYSISSTEAKSDPITTPFTCAYLREHCDACDVCTETCNSPITLGRPSQFVSNSKNSSSITVMPASISYEVVENCTETVEGFTCDYPSHYSLSSQGIATMVKSGDDDFTQKKMTICDYPVKFMNRVYDHIDREDTAHFQVLLPKDGWRDISIKLRDITDQKGQKVAAVLGSAGCLVSSDMQKYMGKFMNEYLKSVIAAAAASKSYAQLGYDEENEIFVMPDKVVKKDGTIAEASISSKVASVAKAMRKRGTLDEWLKVINVYARDGYEPYAFGHAIGYGSLLFRFTNYAGAVVTLLGDSGSGKSTVLETINSIFGHPKDLMLQKRDNEVAKYIKISTMRNIAPCYDEISNIDPKELSDLCYAISQGRDKLRGAQAGGLRDDELTWCCIMPVTSNHSLYERLGTLKSDASAESMRVFEYHIRTHLHQMGKREAQDTFEPLSENYGHAGDIFVPWMMQNQDKCRERVKHWFRRFDEVANVPTQERYWSAIVGATIAGAELSKDLGLNNFDIEKLFNFAVAQTMVARDTVSENKRTAQAQLVDFMNLSIRSAIVLKGGNTDKTPLWVSQEPSNGLQMRIELDKNLAYISRSAIKRWVTESGGDYDSMRKELIAKKIILNESIDKTLSSGSEVVKSGQVTCWLVNLDHREMSGGVPLQVVKMKDVEKDEKVLAYDKPF